MEQSFNDIVRQQKFVDEIDSSIKDQKQKSIDTMDELSNYRQFNDKIIINKCDMFYNMRSEVRDDSFNKLCVVLNSVKDMIPKNSFNEILSIATRMNYRPTVIEKEITTYILKNQKEKTFKLDNSLQYTFKNLKNVEHYINENLSSELIFVVSCKYFSENEIQIAFTKYLHVRYMLLICSPKYDHYRIDNSMQNCMKRCALILLSRNYMDSFTNVTGKIANYFEFFRTIPREKLESAGIKTEFFYS